MTAYFPHLHIHTPIIQSQLPYQYNKMNKNIWLKIESLQPSGSFKLRGIGLCCQTKKAQGAQRFVSSSGGNAGLAVAYAGRCLQIPVTVFVPQTTSEHAKALIAKEGADIVVAGENWQQAHNFALSQMNMHDALIHPFDDPLLWQGHASLIDELSIDIAKPDALICSVGGGGLLCGMAMGLKNNNWHDVPIVAVETRGAASYAAGLYAGHAVDLLKIQTIATSLAATRVCSESLVWSKKHRIESVLVSDAQAVEGSRHLLNMHRLLTEPACGAAVAALNMPSSILETAQNIVVVVCGGVGMRAEQLLNWSAP